MATIARFKNSTDAAFFQSVLKSEGIESQIVDSGLAIVPSDEARIEVADDDVARATALKARYDSESGTRAQLVEDTHPAKGIPFFAIWFFCAVAAFVINDGIVIYTLVEAKESIDWSNLNAIGSLILTLVSTPLWASLGLATNIFLVWLVIRILRRRRARWNHGASQ